MVEKNLDAYIILLKSFRKFFVNQSRILYKEIKTIKYATNYYRNYEAYYSEDQGLTQEMLELEMIYDGIRNIEDKAKYLRTQFKKENGEFSHLIQSINKQYDSSHIAILPIIDSKITQFRNLFDELNFYKQSYFNLIDSKEFSYIPSPKFNKRFRNANLGLYLNKQLNNRKKNSYRSYILEFYEKNNLIDENKNHTIKENIQNFNNTNFFSTWSYSTDHLIKNFNSKVYHSNEKKGKNIYISMSYSYLDKTLLQPIAFHEISHAVKHKKLSYSQQQYLEDSLHTFKHLNIFKKDNPLDDLYKEILCDLSAVYATGYSYIISLIHIGFFELESLFLQHNEFDASDSISEQDIKDMFKIDKNENIVPKKFDFNVNNIYLAVRLLVLIKLCDKLNIKNTYIEGIRYMLKIIFPEDTTNLSEPTFLSIYEFMSETASDYKQSRNLIYSLYEKFQSILLTKELIENFQNRTKKDTLKQFITRASTLNNNIKYLIEQNKNHCYSIYDLLWLIRNHPIAYNNDSSKKITERDINRLYNIFNLFRKGNKNPNIVKMFDNIFKDFFNVEKKQFYDLDLIKYRATKNFHPFVDFLNSKHDKRFNEKIAYVFAPYDIVYLKEIAYKPDIENLYEMYPFRYSRNPSDTINKYLINTPCMYNKEKHKLHIETIDYKFPLKYIREYNSERNIINKYFTDRHSLFLLKEIPTESYKESFDLIIQIKLNHIFDKDDNINLVEFLLDYFDSNDNKKLFSNCKIFKSLGGEDYLIYLTGISLNKTHGFGKKLKELIYHEFTEIFIEIEDLILLNNPNITDKPKEHREIEIISFAKINKQHNKANEYFAKKLLIGTVGETKFLPESNQFSLMKIPTNRFDNIINWYDIKISSKQDNVFIEIKKYLNGIYYQKENIDRGHTFFSDFNIEIMHEYPKETKDKN